MNEILHANIFFIIASIATTCFCILVCIALYHFIKIVKSVRAIVERIEAGSAALADDIEGLRATFLDGGIFTRILNMFFGGQSGESTRRRPRSNRSTINKVRQNYDKEKDDTDDTN